MAIYKCKMCGGSLEISGDSSVVTCDYCGSVQTLPKKNDDVIANLFNRANNLRLKCEFDKAAQVYEKILNEYNGDAEAHWGMVLCKYGIEYVEDPQTYKRIPTCHRTQYESILTDVDYLAALANSDGEPKNVYKQQAEAIANLQKDILAIVKNEKPFDVFICYKETDENGKRTVDSALANDIYYQLTQEGMKVFYAAITLEDKLGVEYEPYIFAALNSAKVMLVVGTKPEYFDAVWVRNEWARYLKLMKADRSKLLIPCYRDMDAYDLPEEFSHLQAQDMSKIGFVNDIVRGIKKITVSPQNEEAVKEAPSAAGGANVASLLERAFMFLEDGDWASADEYCEKVLDVEPKNAQAYLGKLMAEYKISTQDKISKVSFKIDGSSNYQKIMRFGDEELVSSLKKACEAIAVNIQRREEAERRAAEEAKANAWKEDVYKEAVSKSDIKLLYHYQIEALSDAIKKLEGIGDYKDSAAQAENCRQKIYDRAIEWAADKDRFYSDSALAAFKALGDWKDSKARCEKLEAEIKVAERKRQEILKKCLIIGIPAVIVLIIIIVVSSAIKNSSDYKAAEELADNGDKAAAAIAFYELGDYKDAKERSFELWDEVAVRETVSTGENHTVAVKSDGTVVATGLNGYGQCDVIGWSGMDIIAVSASYKCTVGLTADGRVVATGLNEDGQCDVSGWTDIVAVAAGDYHTVGLKADGTVVATGRNNYGQCDVSAWQDIVFVSTSSDYTLGIKTDGTIVCAGFDHDSIVDDLTEWTDIVSVSSEYFYAIGLKSDGTVALAGNDHAIENDSNKWTDIVAISAGGSNYIIGLKSDGTVVYAGDENTLTEKDDHIKEDVDEWTDIVAISAEYGFAVGLKSDGTVAVAGNDYYDRCDVSDWENIKLPE